MTLKRKITYPYLLVFNEKHGDCYFHISNADDYIAAMHKVFTQRCQEGWYHIDEPQPHKELIEIPADLKDQQAIEELERLNKFRRRFNRSQDEAAMEWRDFQRAKSGDREAICDFMETRSDYEYEKFCYERYEPIE